MSSRVDAPPEAAEYFDSREGILALWFGMLAGPAAWYLHLNISYTLVRYICIHGGVWLLHLATVVTLVLAASGVVVSFRSWRRIGEPQETTGEGTLGRSQFLALSGFALSGFFLLTIVVGWIPDLVLHPCPDGP